MTDATASQLPAGWTINHRRVLNIALWVCSVSGSIVFIEPSPYDFLIFLTIAIWIVGGFTVHKGALPFIFLLSLWVFGGFVSLIPYWNEEDPVGFMYHTLFISSTGLFYALFFAENSKERIEICLNGYTLSCVIAAMITTVTWFAGVVDHDRAMLPFKDPNVLGSYMVPGILYLVQKLLLGRIKYLLVTLAALAASSTALFLSFSRGAWGATIISILLLTGMSLYTANSPRMRARIFIAAAIVAAIAVIAVLVVLSNNEMHDLFFARAAVTQDYDEGPTGRFGNQLRAIPMLLELPNGFGPLRFRLIFDLDPHNAYINAFASNGWLGGFAFSALVLLTSYIGFRGSFKSSPYMREMQVAWSATFVFFLQAFQIDIDHWRMFFVVLGAVWGIETARLKWVATGPSQIRWEAHSPSS